MRIARNRLRNGFGLAFLLGMAAPAAGQPVRPVYREIGDWLLACDNTRDCVARQVPRSDRERAAGEDGDVGMDIVRKAGADGTIEVRLRAERRLDPASVRLAGAASPGALPWRRSHDGMDATLSGEAAGRFARAAANAPKLMLARTGPAHLSLSGLAAILLAMDAAQGRIGNAGALVRRGPAPASATPAPVPPPRVVPGPPAPPLADGRTLVAAIRRLHAPAFAAHDCDLPPDDQDAAYPLTASDAIVVIGCGRFAYQASVLVFRTPRTRPAAATLLAMPALPVGSPDAPDCIGEYVEGSYDPATRVFAMSAKGRGLADCGVAAEWTFDGTAFRLTSLHWQDRCGGMAPGDWPVLYRTR